MLSCSDGEVARLYREESKLGDYLDTVADRAGEIAIILGLFVGTWFDIPTAYVAGTFLTYLSMVFLITISSEKFKSVFRQAFPRRQLDGPFAWLATGGDARCVYVSIAIVAAEATGSHTLLLVSLNVLIGMLFLAFLIRMRRIIAYSPGYGH